MDSLEGPSVSPCAQILCFRHYDSILPTRRSKASKPWNIRKRHAPGMHVQAPELGAAVQGRKHLAGIEQTLGVEGAFQPLLLVEVDLGKHRRHQVALFHA